MHFLSLFSIISVFNKNKINKIAHRGYWYNKKQQNSMRSFKNAIKENFDMIETDIQLCKSGEIVVYHDLFIKNKFIKDIEYIDLPNNICNIDDIFNTVDVKETPIYLDLKGNLELSQKLYSYLVEKKLDLLKYIYIGSFNTGHLEIFKNSPYKFKLGFITENNLQYNELKNILNKLEFICVHWTMLDKELVQNCKLLNTKVFTYTCKNLEVYNLIKEYDIDGIVSDIVLKDDK